MIFLVQYNFEAEYLWKVNLKILNSGITLKTLTHVFKLTCKSFNIQTVLLLFDMFCLNLCEHLHIYAWPRGYKTFFMLNSTEHEISTAHKN